MAKYYDENDDRPTKIEKLLRAYKENKLDDLEARNAFEKFIDEFCEDDKEVIAELKYRLESIIDVAKGNY